MAFVDQTTSERVARSVKRSRPILTYYRNVVEPLWLRRGGDANPRITEAEAIAAARKLYRHVFKRRWPGKVEIVRDGKYRRSYSYILGNTLRVNAARGLAELVHELSHSFFARLPAFRGCRPHGGAHANFEASLICWAIDHNWHNGALARKPKESTES